MPTPSERQQIASIVGELEDFAVEITRTITVEVTDELVASTPKDSGWARAGWRPGIGRPQLERIGNRSPGGVATARAQQDIDRALVAGYRGPPVPIHVTSTIPYIEPLNAGHSQQEPIGFVERSIEKGVSVARAKVISRR